MQKSFQYKNTNIGYKKLGEGKAVVLIHGFGEDSNIFNYQINFLKNYCLLIVPDLPGSGRSELLVTGNLQLATISITDYADCIKALIEHENISSCIMLGHSMGGYITLAFAEKYAKQLLGFGLIHSSAFADSEEKKMNRKRGIELMEQYGAYSFLKTVIPNLFSAHSKKIIPQKIELLMDASKKFTTKSCQQYSFAMMNRPDRTLVLKGNTLPVLFVIGTEDVAAPLIDLQQQINLPKCSYIHVLEQVGHMSMIEAPDKLNEFMFKFISQII